MRRAWRFAFCLGLMLAVVSRTCDLRTTAQTAGFMFTAKCTATDTERVEHMLVVGSKVTLIIHDDELWQQAQRLIGSEACEVSLLKGE